MRKKFLEFVYHWSSKLNVWAWNELYGKRDDLYKKKKEGTDEYGVTKK